MRIAFRIFLSFLVFICAIILGGSWPYMPSWLGLKFSVGSTFFCMFVLYRIWRGKVEQKNHQLKERNNNIDFIKDEKINTINKLEVSKNSQTDSSQVVEERNKSLSIRSIPSDALFLIFCIIFLVLILVALLYEK